MVLVTVQEEGDLIHEFILRNVEGIMLMSWWEIIIACVLPLVSTSFVHGQHIKMFILWVRNLCRGSADERAAKYSAAKDKEASKLSKAGKATVNEEICDLQSGNENAQKRAVNNNAEVSLIKN